VRLEHERDEIDAEHARLSERQQGLARQLETARRDVRQLAVTAYVAGGPAGGAERLLEVSDFGELAWRAALIDGQTALTVESARRYAQLLESADAAVRELVQRVDQNHAKLEQALVERFLAGVEDKAAEQELDRARARARAAVSGLTVQVADEVAGDAWARLRACESGGNYQAVSPSGRYRGAYQFDLRTWESVGGEGDPIDAPPAEQDARARTLYARRGRAPWPVCGRFLP
jgi:hypothetical protein